MSTRTAALITAVLTLSLITPQAADYEAFAVAADSDAAIVHVLNRVGFGPRPGDVEKVRKLGLEAYIDLQLQPARIDDQAMAARLAPLSTVGMSTRELNEKFAIPQQEARRQRQLQQGAQPGAQSPDAPNAGQAPQAPQMMPPPQGPNPLMELQEQKLLRAVYSERQLQEVLADFWFNHFNVDARKGQVRFMLTEYEREAIRPHVLGKFRDLLGATAKSPAMLFYLDNFQSVDPDAAMNRGRQQGFGPVRPGRGGIMIQMPQRPPQAQPQNAPRGLNENYARELMELHTLGVDGGYTQKDVTEVARAFTGWSIDNPRQGGGFRFNAQMHDNREKVILGHSIKSGGIRDGEEVLDILAAHPSTARFIATKLARRFVSDTPPAALVDRLAKKFSSTKGDLREVMKTLLTAPEFRSEDAYRAKVKTPLEFIASSVRATGTEVVNVRPLVNAMQQLGMPLYQCQPPTGYKDTAEAWTNTGALVTRMNFALQLATNRQLGMSPNQLRTLGTGDTLLDSVLHGDVADTTRATVARAQTPQQMLALALGSPEFQRR